MPGDRIDVMVFLQKNPTKGIDVTVTRTILQNIQVFAINDKFRLEKGEAEEGTIQAKTVSLLVTPKDAQLLHLASELGEIRLSLRSPEDDEVVVTATTPVSELTSGSGSSNRESEELFSGVPAVLDPSDNGDDAMPLDQSMIAHRMFVIEGPEMWEQVFDGDGRPLKETPAEGPRAGSRDDSLLPLAVDEGELTNDLDEDEDVDGDLDEDD